MTQRKYYTNEESIRLFSTFYLDGIWACYVGHNTAPAPMDKSRPATDEEIANFEAEERRRDEWRQRMKQAEEKEALGLKPKYGFDPRLVGNRPRGFWEENGELVISARDGGGNEPDCKAGSFGKFLGSEQDDFDCTYRYYRYAPISEE